MQIWFNSICMHLEYTSPGPGTPIDGRLHKHTADSSLAMGEGWPFLFLVLQGHVQWHLPLHAEVRTSVPCLPPAVPAVSLLVGSDA